MKRVLLACLWSVVQCFDVGTLQLPTPTFDPNHPNVRQQLTHALGVQAIDVKPLGTNVGLNGGVWVVSDPYRTWDDLIVKLRPVETNYYPSHPPEAVHFKNIAREYPGLAQDPDVIFPSKILECMGPTGKQGDLIVMKKAPGNTLAYYINEKFHQGPQGRTELMTVFESIGQQLRKFHERYDNKQHSDFQSANIMVDGSRGNKITFIDLGGMGLPIGDTDILHLKECLTMLSDAYPGIMELAKRHFETGYYHGRRQDHGRFAQHNSVSQAQAQADAQAQAQAQAWAEAQGQARQQAMKVPAPEGTFRVSMPRAQGDKLGLHLVNRDETAVVKAVKPGVVALWNSRHPDFQVEAGQHVLEVDGFRGSYSDMLQVCKGAYMVGDAVDVWSHSRGWWFSDGRVLAANEEGIMVSFDGGRLTKSIPADSNEMRKKQSTLEMLIGRVPAEVTSFHCKVAKGDGKALGLKLVNRNGVAVVKAVQDGLISDWNGKHLGLQVTAGDQIVEVNQRREGYREIIEMCKTSDVLDLLVQKPPSPVTV